MLLYILPFCTLAVGILFGWLCCEIRRGWIDERDRPKSLADGYHKLMAPHGSPDACCALDCLRDAGRRVSVDWLPGSVALTVAK